MTREDDTVPADEAADTVPAERSPGLRVLMAGGGTAGHTSPLIATADALRRMRPDAQVTALGTPRGIEVRVIPEAGLPLELIPPVPLPRRPGADLVRLPGRLRGAVRATHQVFDRVRPDVVVGFGGYVSVPAYVVAKRRGVPLVAHEGNALPGVANKFAARVCTSHVATSFPDTDLRHASYTGLPIRKLISDTDRDALRPKAREAFGLDPDRPTLLVTGGSQGARRLNEAVGGAARALADAGVQVLHVAGPKGAVQVGREPGDPPYVVLPYVDRMDLAYSAADALVCRCGSNTVTEVASLGIPAVFVPLPHGNGEQAFNAKAVVEAGGGLLVDDAALTPVWVAENVPPLLTDADRLAAMGAAAEGLIPRDADDRLAAMVLEVAGSGT
jgi:UDP-N-acetylglucosamine--N-acetylmuramyl-(pentapeptide) pyrophosphoryl-undecaprenol N-acetylglucosamine transferase